MKTAFQKLGIITLLATALLFNVAANAANNLYFYGGDFDPTNPNANGLANENVNGDMGNPYGSATFQNFYTGATGPTVTGLFTNNLWNFVFGGPSFGYWEIRKGVSGGNGGQMVSSGTYFPATWTPTGRSFQGLNEYTYLVGCGGQPNCTPLNVSLQPNTQYWFAVVPLCEACGGHSYNSNTFGLNSVGKSDLNKEYFNSISQNINYENANDFGAFPTFSSGVYAVPEPSGMIMLGTGLLAAAGIVRRRVLS